MRLCLAYEDLPEPVAEIKKPTPEQQQQPEPSAPVEPVPPVWHAGEKQKFSLFKKKENGKL